MTVLQRQAQAVQADERTSARPRRIPWISGCTSERTSSSIDDGRRRQHTSISDFLSLIIPLMLAWSNRSLSCWDEFFYVLPRTGEDKIMVRLRKPHGQHTSHDAPHRPRRERRIRRERREHSSVSLTSDAMRWRFGPWYSSTRYKKKGQSTLIICSMSYCDE